MRRLRHLAGPAGRLVGGVAERPRSGRRCDGPRVSAPPRSVWDPDYEAGGRRDNGLGCGWSRSAATAGGAQDEVGNLLRVSDQRQVTGVHLDRLRMHTACKETLQLRGRGSISLRYGIPRRLELPRCGGRPRGEQRVGDPPLNRVEHTCPGWIDAAGEVLEEGLLAQLGEAARLDEADICWWRGKLGSQCRIVLAGIRRASGDVDKGRDFGINPASLMTVPAQEWPTRTVGPSCSA